MNKRHYEHTLPNIRGSLSNTYSSLQMIEDELYGKYKEFYGYVFFIAKKVD